MLNKSTSKKVVSMRLSEDTIKELNSLAKQQGVGQADIVSVLVHFCYSGWIEEERDKLDEWFEIARRS